MATTKKTATVHIDSLTTDWHTCDLMRAFDEHECEPPLIFESIGADEVDLEDELGSHPIVKYDGSTVLLMAANEGKCNLVPWRIVQCETEAISADEFKAVLAAIDGWLVAVLVPVDETNSLPTIGFAFIRKKKWLRAGSPTWIDVTDKPASPTVTVATKDARSSKVKQAG